MSCARGLADTRARSAPQASQAAALLAARGRAAIDPPTSTDPYAHAAAQLQRDAVTQRFGYGSQVYR